MKAGQALTKNAKTAITSSLLAMSLCAFAGEWTQSSRKDCAAGGDLRGFGRVATAYETWADGADVVEATVFRTAGAAEAETVLGKYIWDQSWNMAKAEDGLLVTPGGRAFAFAKSGAVAAIYVADDRNVLRRFVDGRGLSSSLVTVAKCPEWMKRFDWGLYGMGGLENFHEWMYKASGDRQRQLDPREDFEFLRDMGPMHFDNWLQLEGLDNSDGITAANGVYAKAKYAEELGIPYSYRLYMPCNGFDWVNRRFADCMERPAGWMLNGWLRYGHSYQPHASWYNDDIWKYFGYQTRKEMLKFKTDKVRGWMHPAGELVHQTWYDMHSDYSAAAKHDWHAWLRKHGVTLAEASAMYSREDRPFQAWDQVEVPEFATFAGLPGMKLDLAGVWFSSSNREEWTAIDMPGNWEYMKYYSRSDPGRFAKTVRYMKRCFSWDPSMAGGESAYLYFFPMSQENTRHALTLNGRRFEIGQWCALDVTDVLRQGANELEVEMHGYFWNGRIFVSTQKPATYPYLGEARNRMWTLWNDWRRAAKERQCRVVFDAMREADPDAPIKFMAPLRFGFPITSSLAVDYGMHAHFTGEGVWYFPWYKRYGKVWGYQGTSELAGPYDTVADAKRSLLRVFLAGLDMHEPVFTTQVYSRNPPVREWWLRHKPLLERMGKYDIFGPQVLIYRRSLLCEDNFPAPYPSCGGTSRRSNMPWDWDIGRGALQSIGQSMLYVDDDAIAAGKIYDYKLMFDCGNEVVEPREVAGIAAWVKEGGTFVALPFTGRSTGLEPDSWPIAALTGAKVAKIRPLGGTVSYGGRTYPDCGRSTIANGNNVNEYSCELKPEAEDVEVIATYDNGAAAVTLRRLGKGLVVSLGSAFWRDSADVNGIWWPGRGESEFLEGLLARVGFDKALCKTDTDLVWAQPYRSDDGMDFVSCFCNFNTNDIVARATLRVPSKPRKLVAYGADGVTHPAFEYADGIATFDLHVEGEDVKVVNAEVYDPDDAVNYWWKENQIAWRELKKPTTDFSGFGEGRWKDPTQDLKTGWTFEDGRPCVCDALQFWGLPDGAPAKITKRFDVADADWFKGGVTRFVCGAWTGPNFLSKGRIFLNGEALTDKSAEHRYIERDVTKILRPAGNELVIEFEAPAGGRKFTGLLGSVHLYHRAFAARSFELAKEGRTRTVYIPKEWDGRYRVFLYMEDAKKQPPTGVAANHRWMRKHHHNFGKVTDIDITSILKFGEDNVLTLGHEFSVSRDFGRIDTVRLDLFEVPGRNPTVAQER